MKSLNYNQFLSLIAKYDKFDEKTLKSMYKVFGKDKINGYFEEYCQTLSPNEVSEFVKKYSAYFEQQEEEFDENENFTTELGSAVGMLINNALLYTMMNYEVEYEQGVNLVECKKNLTIANGIDNLNVLYPNLNLEKVFISVKSKEELSSIEKIRRLPYSLGDESILKTELSNIKKFLKLSTNKILTIDELKKEFPSLCFDNVEPVDDLDNQLELFRKYIIAKFNFYNRNLRLVISMAKRNSIEIPLEDRIQDGNIGLIRAINKFDVYKGYKFSTYAIWWIKQSINRGVAEKADIIRKPVHLYDKIRKYKNFYGKFISSNGYAPSTEECALGLSMSKSEILELEQLALDFISLNSQIKSNNVEEGDEFINFIVDDNASTEQDAIYNDLLNCVLKEIDSFLSGRDRQILLDRMGLNELEKVYTLQEIADRYGVTRERVRQLEAKSKRRLRLKLQYKGIVSENNFI